MILFTGGGAFYEAFKKLKDCTRLSLRETEPEQWAEALPKAKVLIHNAANINCRNVEEAVQDNFLPTFKIVILCKAHNPNIRFIYLGSMSYLASELDYLPEEEMTPYAYSKYLAESLCLKHALPDVHAVRFSTLFYADPQRDGLSKLVADAVGRNAISIYNEGRAKRDFIPIEVAAEYVAKIASKSAGVTASHADTDRIHNIASGHATSFGEIAAFLKKRLPGLTVNDVPAPNGKEVLSTFSTESVRRLGEIPFSLEEKIEANIQRLHNPGRVQNPAGVGVELQDK